MKDFIEEVRATDDVSVLKNVVSIMAEACAGGLNGASLLETMKKVKSEIGGTSYDYDMARLHLCLIGNLPVMEDAARYWDGHAGDRIGEFDWYVLWGEMVRRNERKIRKWFPGITREELNQKVYDECISAIDTGCIPFHDFSV